MDGTTARRAATATLVAVRHEPPPPCDHGDEDAVRDHRRDPVHVRGWRLLDLRARRDDRAGAVPPTAPATARDPRYLGPDRHEARRLRPRAVPARRHRRD